MRYFMVLFFVTATVWGQVGNEEVTWVDSLSGKAFAMRSESEPLIVRDATGNVRIWAGMLDGVPVAAMLTKEGTPTLLIDGDVDGYIVSNPLRRRVFLLDMYGKYVQYNGYPAGAETLPCWTLPIEEQEPHERRAIELMQHLCKWPTQTSKNVFLDRFEEDLENDFRALEQLDRNARMAASCERIEHQSALLQTLERLEVEIREPAPTQTPARQIQSATPCVWSGPHWHILEDGAGHFSGPHSKNAEPDYWYEPTLKTVEDVKSTEQYRRTIEERLSRLEKILAAPSFYVSGSDMHFKGKSNLFHTISKGNWDRLNSAVRSLRKYVEEGR